MPWIRLREAGFEGGAGSGLQRGTCEAVATRWDATCGGHRAAREPGELDKQQFLGEARSTAAADGLGGIVMGSTGFFLFKIFFLFY